VPPSCVAYTAPGWGVGRLWVAGVRLLQHELPTPEPDAGPPSPQGERGAPSGTLSAPASRESDDFARKVARRLQAYFDGERASFDDVPLAEVGWTAFQLDVAAALRRVPYSDVVTYGELAALAGHPNAQRAAGSFCARNPFPLVLPCHRVVAAGGLGSYGSLGVDYKRRLLRLEGVDL
jgi:methylated-DNA-[protein]-cysteine S-methyltransferase